jgi:hypothetical protein
MSWPKVLMKADLRVPYCPKQCARGEEKEKAERGQIT